MNITLTGATGFIGSRLVDRLKREGHSLTILSRKQRTGSGVRYLAWDPMREDAPAEAFENSDAVIHLAGEPVAQRWNEEVKRRIRDSRIEGTRRLVNTLAKLDRKPAALVSASAIGIYGSRGEETLSEEAAPAHGYLAGVTVGWEREAQKAGELGIRVVMIRIGIVLGDGGALETMLPPFRLGAGGRLGSGRQWMSWIHVDDLVSMILYALGRPEARGAWNGTAPEPVRNDEFTRELAAAVHRPAIFPVPEFALKVMFGEMATVMLASQRVIPAAPEAAGFRFEYPKLRPALQQILNRP